jgi:hypothetical protein
VSAQKTARCFHGAVIEIVVLGKSDDSRFFERHEGTILVDGLQRAAAELDADELVELRHPDLEYCKCVP